MYPVAGTWYGFPRFNWWVVRVNRVGGSTSDVRDGDHLGIINFEVTITEDTPLGLILINFPVTLGIDWIQPEKRVDGIQLRQREVQT